MAITDAPVDGVTEVWVEFNGVTLKPAGGPQQRFEFDTPKSINLKGLTDGKVELLLDEEVPAGEYLWTRLHVNADIDGIMDSYVTQDGGGQIELWVPPDRLQLISGFTVAAGGTSSFVIDWNLRMGLTDPVGISDGYKLQPTLRIIDMTEHGTIAGTVDANLLPPVVEACSSDPNTGEGNVVYIYEGSDVIPDDIDGNLPDPISTADVALNQDTGLQEYRAVFLPPGDYTVAFTCQGGDDVQTDPDQPGLDTDDTLLFSTGINAEVMTDMVTEANFTAP